MAESKKEREVRVTEECKGCNGRGWVGPESPLGVGFHGPNTCTACKGRGYIEIKKKQG